MILYGLKLTVVGMSVTFMYLVVMIGMVNLISRFMNNKKPNIKKIAAIAAAVHKSRS